MLRGDDVRGTSLESPLRKLFHLHLLSTLERDLAWFVENGHLTSEQAEQVRNKDIVTRPMRSLLTIVTYCILYSP